MKILAAAAIGFLGFAGTFWMQDRERPVTSGERTRFLFHGVYEGLIEDGAQAEVVERVLAKRTEWFVGKCPICDSVVSAFQAYLDLCKRHGWKTDRKDGLPMWFGGGLPKETVEALKSDDVKRCHGALQSLVGKYVGRRFETLQMTAGRKDRMQEALKIGMKEGLNRMKESGSEELFPTSCPSCEGAN